MDRSKLLEYFDASKYDLPVHVVGCGAIGSHVCEELARLGFTKVELYDFDTVDAHNITNQMFSQENIGELKVTVCAEMMREINPDITLTLHPEGLKEPYICAGIVILCVDNIDLRREIAKANYYNPFCRVMLDFRMRLTDAQHYLATWNNVFEKDTFINTMDFSHDEAVEATPMSACGVELSVVYTVKTITAFGMANLVKWLQQQDYKTMCLVNMDMFTVDAFKAVPRKKKTFLNIVNAVAAAQQGSN